MRDFSAYRQMYFLGIGGIGMSALARYFFQEGIAVSGYDQTQTRLTKELESEGIAIHFDDKAEQIKNLIGKKEDVLVVITPAIPKTLKELLFLQKEGYNFVKRAELLGWVTRENIGLAVAGTHGKTTTSCLLAHVLKNSEKGCKAFLGGISANYKTNFIADKSSDYAVVEADEFDRSFLHLRPFASILTSVDADHLDIYGDTSQLEQAFNEYVQRIDEEGFLVKHDAIPILHKGKNITYSLNNSDSDYQAVNLRFENGMFVFDLNTPFGKWQDVELGIPGLHNVENAIAVIALCVELGLTENELRKSLRSFTGVNRRFEIVYRSEKQVFIDDYAHHPTAITQLIKSVRLMFPDKKICGVFQPHLYSRTSDFMDGFATSLAALDQLVLMPIYPAREEPIKGVTSEVLASKINMNDKHVLAANEVTAFVDKWEGVILTIGAGNISDIVPKINAALNE
jgi:UDP-N-acetylmuramate--alanine ligase